MSNLEKTVNQNLNILQDLGCRSNSILIVARYIYKKRVVGYAIENTGKEVIKNINVAEYKTKKLEKVNLHINEALILPTKWLVLLLFRPEYCLKVANGEFVSIKNKVSDNIDDICRNYKLKEDKDNNIVEIDITDKNGFVKKEYKNKFSYLEKDMNYLGLSFLKILTEDNGDCRCLIKH